VRFLVHCDETFKNEAHGKKGQFKDIFFHLSSPTTNLNLVSQTRSLQPRPQQLLSNVFGLEQDSAFVLCMTIGGRETI